jgi:hypothetical protein
MQWITGCLVSCVCTGRLRAFCQSFKPLNMNNSECLHGIAEISPFEHPNLISAPAWIPVGTPLLHRYCGIPCWNWLSLRGDAGCPYNTWMDGWKDSSSVFLMASYIIILYYYIITYYFLMAPNAHQHIFFRHHGCDNPRFVDSFWFAHLVYTCSNYPLVI